MISYIGGKSRMAKWICEYIPKDIETYVEVFGGAFWVYVKGDVHTTPTLKEVIYNDKNEFMVNFMKCCSDPYAFLHYIKDVKSQDEKLFYEYQKEINEMDVLNVPDFKTAMKYAYIATQVFSGSKIMESKFIDLKGKYKSKFDAFRNRLSKTEISSKLSKITECENLDYSDCIIKYDSPNTFFYVDPPYWKTEDYYSGNNFDSTDHELMSILLSEIRGRFALSYYDFKELSMMYPKNEFRWIEKDFSKAAGATKGKKQNKGTELLIMNY